MKTLAAFLIFSFGFFMGMWCGTILTSYLIESTQVVQVEPSSQYPEIPRCDKPLWNRIRHGCDDRKGEVNVGP